MAVVAVAFLGFAGSAAADRSTALLSSFTLSGHGYGPGVGLSQWGAEERAAAGQTHEQILAFYYPGTTISTTDSTTIRVLLAEQAKLIVGSSAPFTIVDSAGKAVRVRAGHYPVTAHGIDGSALTFPTQVLAGSAPVMLGGSRYRGSLQLSLDGGDLRAVNALPLEQYVADVVSVENPGYWPQEALRSQAIASRSYALANLHPDAAFDLYSDNRSQNYVGLRKEFPSAVEATAATSGQVLRYQGQIVDAFFTASNGGMTSNTEGIWSGTPLPYLAERPDPFDARSPGNSWGPLRVSWPELRQAFPQLPMGVVHMGLTTNGGDRVSSVTFVSSDGSSYQIDGRAFQQRLGLRSAYIELAASYTY
jgi:stage II sporulation protein D